MEISHIKEWILKELKEAKELSPQELFSLVDSKFSPARKNLRKALESLKPLSTKLGISADEISRAIANASKTCNLSADETAILWLALTGPGQGGGPVEGPAGMGEGSRGTPPPEIKEDTAEKVAELFEIVEGTINNRRAQFVADANSFIDRLEDIEGVAGKFKHLSFDKMMLTARMRTNAEELIERALALVDADIPYELLEKIKGLKDEIIKVEADSIIASIIAASRKAREGEKIIIGLETDWIPGMDEKGYGSQRDAMTPLIREVENIGASLKALGLGNIEIIHRKSADLKEAVLARAQETNTGMQNILILGSSSTIRALMEQGAFARRNTRGVEERAFLAGIEPSNVMRVYAEAQRQGNAGVNINLLQLLSIALELSLGKEPPEMPIIASYDSKNRVLMLLPVADVVDYDLLKGVYEAQKAALRSA